MNSSQAEMVLKQCEDHGLPVPESLQNPPQLSAWLEYVFSAFEALSVSRAAISSMEGVIEGYIPWRDMHLWCRAEGLNYCEEHDVLYLLKAMDRFYVEHTNKKRASSCRSGSAKKI